MKTLWVQGWTPAFLLTVLIGPPAPGIAAQPSVYGPIYANLHGEMLLDNPRVIVQKFVVEPGQSTGRHTHPGDQLAVFIKGGVLTSRTSGRSTLWREGRVMWQNASDPADDGSTNTGTTPIEVVWVTLKPVASQTPAAASGKNVKYHYLNYPNIPGEDLLENDLVIVQRFTVNPGQWEGVHAHNRHQRRPRVWECRQQPDRPDLGDAEEVAGAGNPVSMGL